MGLPTRAGYQATAESGNLSMTTFKAGADLHSLDRAAAAVREAQVATALAGALVSSDPGQATEQARAAKKHCLTALEYLEALGARIPGVEGAQPPAPVRLEMLDTPANRRFHVALEAAAAAAAEVDRERGNVDRDGEPTGYGETLAGMAMTVGTEIYGPEGRE
jgi:hypothetical protein